MVQTNLLTRVDIELELKGARDLTLMPVNGISLRLDETGSVFAEDADKTYTLTNDARRGLLKHVGVTDKFVRELAAANPVLASAVATTMYQTRGSEGVFAMQGETPVSFGSRGKFSALPVDDVLEGIEEVIGPAVQFNRAFLGRNMEVQVEVVGTRSETVRVGDVIQSGVLVRFNPLGLTNPYVAPYGLRLVCSNGMTALSEYGGGELPLVAYKDSPVTWIIEQCRSAYDGLALAAKDWRQMSEHVLEPGTWRTVLARALDDAGIRGRQAVLVMKEAMREPPETTYDILNLITWASSHILDNANSVMRVQDAAVNFTSMATDEKTCPACQRKV